MSQRPSTQDLLCSAFIYCTAAWTPKEPKDSTRVTKSKHLLMQAKETDVFAPLERQDITSLSRRMEKSHNKNCLLHPQRQECRASESKPVLIASYFGLFVDFISNDEAKKKKEAKRTKRFSSPKSRRIKIDQNMNKQIFHIKYTVAQHTCIAGIRPTISHQK